MSRVIQKKNTTANPNEFSTIYFVYDTQGRLILQSLPYITDTIDYTDDSLMFTYVHNESNSDANTVALWHMNGTLASNAKKDAVSQDVNYRLDEMGVASTDGFNNLSDGAYHFSNTQNLKVNDFSNNGLDLQSTDFTLETWVKFDSAPSPDSIKAMISKYDDNNHKDQYLLSYRDDTNGSGSKGIWAVISSDGTRDNNQVSYSHYWSFTPLIDVWYYITMTYDRSEGTVEVYINGISQGVVVGFPNSIYDGSEEFRIGSVDGSAFWNGSIDETSISSRIKTAQEILDHYNDYSPAYGTVPDKTYIYDILGRVLAETTPVGTTSYEYNGFTTKITDANGNFKELTKDTHGNLVEVKEYNGNEIYTTSYEYTLTNKLKKITDSDGNIRNFSYDALDNLEWQDMVHKTSVTNPAKIQYTYDKNGNVLTETSFKNDAISYTYDNLNRPLTEKLSGVTKISYAYDQNGDIGQLTFADYGSSSYIAYDYDILGRLKTATTTIASETFVMNYDYDLNGNLKEIVYPDDKVVNYGFNTTGQVDEVSLDQGQGANILADNIEYNQNGQMTHVERANGVDTDYTYDPAESFRLTDMVSTVATSTLQSIAYTYDNVGNITNITDDSDTDLAKSANYYYDGLYRLATSTVSYTTHSGDNYTQTFAYDSIGNMTSNSDLGTMNYANGQPHQLSSYGSRNFQYDAAGNVTRNGGINKFLWDWRNRLSVSNDIASNNNTYYQYDHNNQRFIKWTEDYVFIPPDIEQEEAVGGRNMLSQDLVDGAETDSAGHWEWQVVALDKYVDNYFEKDIVNDTKAHIYLNSTKLATVNNNDDPYFILSDHLNSSTITTDDGGNIQELSDYASFGVETYSNIIQTTGDDYGFSSKELDPENDLQYFVNRYYDGEIGKFSSVDPILFIKPQDNIGDPQQLNTSWTTGKSSSMSKSNWRKNMRSKNNWISIQGEYLSDPQRLNSYSYAQNNPLTFIDPTGETAYHFSFGTNAGLGGEGGNSWTIGFATDGTFGISTSLHGGGLAGVDASIGVSVGYSNAETWSDTLGTGQYAELGGKLLTGGSITTNFSDGEYSGADVGLGIGIRGLPPVPITLSGGVEKTVPVFQGNVKGIVNNIDLGYNSVKNTITNSVNNMRQGTNNLFNYVRSIF